MAHRRGPAPPSMGSPSMNKPLPPSPSRQVDASIHHDASSTSSNLKLFALGILLALASVAYAQLPEYLPRSIGSRLPLVGSSGTIDKRGQRWTRLSSYQQSVPVTKNHDPFDVQGPADELKLRLLSKEGKNEQDKQDKRVQRDQDNLARWSMDENKIHDVLPVYFVQQATSEAAVDPRSSLGKILARVGDEIVSRVSPKTVILLAPVRSEGQHVTVSTSSTLLYSSSSLSNLGPVSGNPSLAAQILNTFAHSTPSVAATSSQSTVLNSPAGPVYQAMFGKAEQRDRPDVVLVSLPVVDAGDDKDTTAKKSKNSHATNGWTPEQMYDVGHALLKIRQTRQDVVVIGVGALRPSNPSSFFKTQLTDALSHHTSHARHNVLLSLLNGTKGSKPTNKVNLRQAALYAAIGAAGEGEGESIDDLGLCWRFGALPLS
ncbi:hypothetical protein OIO90_006268 [Microbotryomycetes sp. JL221]|nr:hypothetical protein OIO90_006268 [Microbotryomycetes sp. JL221]